MGGAWSLSLAASELGASQLEETPASLVGGLTSALTPPGRYLYNRMGYWSDWSVPILVTTAAAFTYISGLLVRAAAPRGREAWSVSG